MKTILIILGCLYFTVSYSQPVPAKDENIPYLVTFGKDADRSWGDYELCQIFFCRIPFSCKSPFYVRIFDPDTGGAIDEQKADFNTVIRPGLERIMSDQESIGVIDSNDESF